MSHDILQNDTRGGGVTVVAGGGAGAGVGVAVAAGLPAPPVSPPEAGSATLSDGEILLASCVGVPALSSESELRIVVDPTVGKGSGDLLLSPPRANALALVLAGSGV